MKITFYSNFLNHHQLPFCHEMLQMKDIDFTFVATVPIDSGRLSLGYADMNNAYDFVVRSYENEDMAYKLADESDVVIIGSAPDKYIKNRIKTNKITFRYSERIFKSGFNLKMWLSLIKHYSLKEKKAYLLCSSAYTAYDFNRAFCYKNRTYKWGYFPESIKYDIEKLLKKKKKNKKIQILWVGRFLDWKHPEKALLVAKRLLNEKIDFFLKMIGIGDEMAKIEKMLSELGLNNYVELVGSVNYQKVRHYMEEANIFLFTSDYNEGWGAVLNEAMNSGCAVVASHAIGSVPFVVKNNYNGLVYKNDNIDDLCNKVLMLVNNQKLQYELGYNAYNTIVSTWNAKIATDNLIKLIKALQNKERNSIKDGPCSVALPIPNKKMYNYLVRSADDKKNN